MKMTKKSFLEGKPFFYQNQIYMYHSDEILTLTPESFCKWSRYCELVEDTEKNITVVAYLFDIRVFKTIPFDEMERVKSSSMVRNFEANNEKNKDADLPF